ncbi:8046_t:CDS:1, partial [Cetraspora pellucida]
KEKKLHVVPAKAGEKDAMEVTSVRNRAIIVVRMEKNALMYCKSPSI